MPKRRTINLTPEEQAELEAIRDRHEKPYVRERAAAILKVAAGDSGHHVAKQGLLKPRDPDTVYDWLDRYEAKGIPGLMIEEGRGRKPAFSPSARGGERSQASDLVGVATVPWSIRLSA